MSCGRLRSPAQKDKSSAEVEQGSLYIGSPDTVARKIAGTVRDLKLARFDMKYTTGPIEAAAQLDCVRLYGEKVMPMVRDILASDGVRKS